MKRRGFFQLLLGAVVAPTTSIEHDLVMLNRDVDVSRKDWIAADPGFDEDDFIFIDGDIDYGMFPGLESWLPAEPLRR